jgi:Ankyrin repeats (3 copies)
MIGILTMNRAQHDQDSTKMSLSPPLPTPPPSTAQARALGNKRKLAKSDDEMNLAPWNPLDFLVESMTSAAMKPPLAAMSISFSSPRVMSSTKKARLSLTAVDSIKADYDASCELIVSPSTYMTASLENKGVKSRIDRFSLEQAMFFEPYQESHIRTHVLHVLRTNDLQRLQSLRGMDHDDENDPDDEGERGFHARNQLGENLVHIACRLGLDTEMVRFLVQDGGVPLNVRDRFGRSPLHHACMSARGPNFDTVELLLTHSSKLVLFEDDQGKTPFEYIPDQSFDRWTRFLCERNILKRVSGELEQHASLRVK